MIGDPGRHVPVEVTGVVMIPEGAPWLTIDMARHIVTSHVYQPCGQCRGDRCWMRESAFKIVLLGGEPVRPDMVGAVTIAAREIADVHRPGDDGLCLPCLRRDCEPRRVAWVWLVATRDPMVRAMPRTVVDVLSPDLDEALLVLKQHEVYGCPQCTPGGCLVEESAMVARFDATVAGLPAGPATVDNLRRIAREIQGAPSEGDQGGGAPGSAG